MSLPALSPFLPGKALASADLVSDVLLAFEAAPWRAPSIIASPGGVGVQCGRFFLLSPDEARLTAYALWDDPCEPGFAETAARLNDAADTAETLNPPA